MTISLYQNYILGNRFNENPGRTKYFTGRGLQLRPEIIDNFGKKLINGFILKA